MKKISLAATVALALLGATTVANANGTVKSQPAATTTAAAPATDAVVKTDMAAKTPVSGAKNPASAELIARPANHQSTNFELDFMVPVWQPSCGDRLLAIDMRGMTDTRRNKEGNFGGVYRQIVNNCFVLGGYVYGDYRRTRNHNNFGQFTFGADYLSNMIDARLNGYIAQNKIKPIKGAATTTTFVGNNILASNKFEAAQSGFDGEVGVRIPMPGMNNVETRVFAGGYRFSRSSTRTMAGPRGRLEVRILDLINPGSRLTLGVDVSHDSVRNTTVNGVIGLRIPLQFVSGGKVPQGLQRRLADYVYRDVNVNTGEVSKSHLMQDPRTGKDYFVVNFKGSGSATAATTQSGDGTAENPFAVFNDAGAQAKIAAQAATLTRITGSGTITGNSTSVTPLNNQIYFGPNHDLILQDGKDGRFVKVQTASSAGGGITMTDGVGTAAQFVVGAANPTVKIAGFTYVPSAAVGRAATAGLISGTYTGNASVTIQDMIITGNATSTAAQINLAFNGAQTSSFTGSNIAFNGFVAGPAGGNNVATGIQVLNGTAATFGGNVTVNTNKISITGATAAAAIVGQRINTISSTTKFTDTGSTYSTVNIGVAVGDLTGAVATAGKVDFTINNATVSGLVAGGAGVAVNRASAAGAMSNTTITGAVNKSTFTGAAASQDIFVGTGTGGAGPNTTGNVVLTLADNKHTSTSGGANAVQVEQQVTALNPSTVVVNMNNVGITSAAGASSILLTTAAGITQVGSVKMVLNKVTTTGGANSIGFDAGGVAPGATANQIQLDFSAGNNVMDATTNSVFGNGKITTVASVGVASPTVTFAPIAAGMGGGAGTLGAQFPKAVSIP